MQSVQVRPHSLWIAPDAIVVTVEANDGANGTEADGVLDITVEGGTPPYGYSWTGPGYTGQTRIQAALLPVIMK